MKANQELRKRNKYIPGSQMHKHIATKHNSKETFPVLSDDEIERIRRKFLQTEKYNRFAKILAVVLTILLTPLVMYIFYLFVVFILS